MELREIIARELCRQGNWDWDGIPEKITHLFPYSTSKSHYYNRADEILEAIAQAQLESEINKLGMR